MLSKGTVNYKAVVEKMQRDTGFTQYYDEECKEWLWEIMSLIGLNSLLTTSQVDIEIEDYRGLLPINLESIIGVKNFDTNNVIIQDLGVYDKRINSLSEHGVTRVVSDGVSYTSVDGTITPDLSHVMVDIERPMSMSPSNYRYKVQGSYIYIDGMKTGTITVAYTAFPIEDNAPVIPNDSKILELCSWYIATKIAFRLMLKGELTKGVKDDIEQQYLFYAKSARMKALTPNYEMMEAMKMRMGLIPDTNRHAFGFTNR